MLQEYEDTKAGIYRAHALKKVFDRLKGKDLKNVSLVSKEWNKLSIESRFSHLKLNALGRRMNYMPIVGDDIQVLENVREFIEFTRRYGYLATSINVDFGLDHQLIRQMMHPLTNITELTLTSCTIKGASLMEYLKPLERIEKLSFSNVNLYDDKDTQLCDYKLPDSLKVLRFDLFFYKSVKSVYYNSREPYHSFEDSRENSCHKLLTSHKRVRELHFARSQAELLEPFASNYPTLSKLAIANSKEGELSSEFYEVIKNNSQLSDIALQGIENPTQFINTVAENISNIKQFIIKNINRDSIKRFPEFPSFENQAQVYKNRLVLNHTATDNPQYITNLIGHMPEVKVINVNLNQGYSLVMTSISRQAKDLTMLVLSAPMEDNEIYTNDPSFSDFFKNEFNNRSYSCFQTLRAIYLSGFDPIKLEPEYFNQFKKLELICLTFDYKMNSSMDQVKEIKEKFEKFENWEIKRYFSVYGSVVLLESPDSTLKVPKY